MDKSAWLAFSRLRYENPDDALREIAQFVREGCADPTFLRLLASHIDPDVERTPFGTKFRLRRTTGRKSPPAAPNHALREFLETHIDIFKDYQAEAVKAEAMARFGVARSKCTSELAIMRRWQKRDPDSFQFRKDAAMRMREAGHPDFQPLWPRK